MRVDTLSRNFFWFALLASAMFFGCRTSVSVSESKALNVAKQRVQIETINKFNGEITNFRIAGKALRTFGKLPLLLGKSKSEFPELFSCAWGPFGIKDESFLRLLGRDPVEVVSLDADEVKGVQFFVWYSNMHEEITASWVADAIVVSIVNDEIKSVDVTAMCLY